jgi:hypothetical protein
MMERHGRDAPIRIPPEQPHPDPAGPRPRRRRSSGEDSSRARGGRPLGRIRIPNRTPARGDVVRPSAFLNTLLHEFCHHHDAEALRLSRSFHTAGFYARLRHLREQLTVHGL